MTSNTERNDTSASGTRQMNGQPDKRAVPSDPRRNGTDDSGSEQSTNVRKAGKQLEVLQIASSQMEFYQDQVRILEEMGLSCDSLAYPPDESHTEGDIRRKSIHDGLISRIYGHNALYYGFRAADFYPRILKAAMRKEYDLVHLNSGMIAPLGLLQPKRPIVLTLWGDDLLSDRFGGYQPAITRFCAKRCDRIIVRSEEMQAALPCDSTVLPSGIDMAKFRPVDQAEARRRVGWEQDGRHVLFPYSKDQTKKRYPVAKDVIDQVNACFDDDVSLQVVDNVPHEKMYLYYNAADVLLLPSLREGSPNTVKEAMACNVPVVSTNVGDVADRLGPVRNSHVCPSDDAMIDAVLSVLDTGGRSDGREYVAEVSLKRMGERLVEIYESVLED